MARRSNTTTANGIGSDFNDAPITDGGSGSAESGATIIDGADANGLLTVNPADIGSGGNSDSDDSGSDVKRNKDGTVAKQRGRKPGQKNGSAKTGTAVSVNGLEKTLVGIHTALAAMTHDPAWNISKDEAKALSEASANVARHYNATLSPKVADWLVLIGVLGTLYGPRIAPLALRAIGKKPRAQNRQPDPQPDADMPMPNFPPVGNFHATH